MKTLSCHTTQCFQILIIPWRNWIMLALSIILSVSCFFFHVKNVKFITKIYRQVANFMVYRLFYYYQKRVALFEREICISGDGLRSYCRFTWIPGLTFLGCFMFSVYLFDYAKPFSSRWPFNRNKHFQNIFCSFMCENGNVWSLSLHNHSNLLQKYYLQ